MVTPRLLRKIERKRFFRRIRSRLKRRLRRGGRLRAAAKTKYRLKPVDPYDRIRFRAHHKGLEFRIVKILENLSYFENPFETSVFFESLQVALSKTTPFNLDISHKTTRRLGLAESFLFDQLIKQHKARWDARRIPVGVKGTISDVKDVNNFLLSFGLLKELGIPPAKFAATHLDPDYEKKFVTHKSQGSSQQSTQKGIASVALIEYFDNCLRVNGFQMIPKAKGDLINAMGEIIGNAEEHSGNPNNEWHALGCYNKDTHRCDFAIINYGRTIFETLSDKQSTAVDVVKDIETVLLAQKEWYEKLTKLFGDKFKFAPHQEEPLWNVMALQDGISSKRTAGGAVGNTRGQGLMDFLGFIDGIKTEGTAELFLLSGHSLIKIDYEYPIAKHAVGPNKEMRRFLAFNKQGDLHYLPDNEKVIYLRQKFPGTILAGSFNIDQLYLTKKFAKGT